MYTTRSPSMVGGQCCCETVTLQLHNSYITLTFAVTVSAVLSGSCHTCSLLVFACVCICF
jgi:hypothetical protein